MVFPLEMIELVAKGDTLIFNCPFSIFNSFKKEPDLPLQKGRKNGIILYCISVC